MPAGGAGLGRLAQRRRLEDPAAADRWRVSLEVNRSASEEPTVESEECVVDGRSLASSKRGRTAMAASPRASLKITRCPPGVDPTLVSSSLSPEGRLTVGASMPSQLEAPEAGKLGSLEPSEGLSLAVHPPPQ